jgi:UDP-3-O-[3-hydroxymyristoyl] N-acetylglucosamine deacetylase / 3-hydroxyacyl-[acyl-carrier-protein] dehydratase
MKQQTILHPMSLSGVGLHTGAVVTITIQAAPENHGIKFKRIDLESMPIIPAEVAKVTATNRGTVIQVGTATVSTIEHLLSACVALGIDNLLVDIDGPEVPIMDGSALPFIELLEKAESVQQEADASVLVIEEILYFKDEATGAEYIAYPSVEYAVTSVIDFNSKIICQQSATLDKISDYKATLAPARTFVFLHELKFLLEQNLIKGGDLDNAIVIADEIPTESELAVLAQWLNKPDIAVSSEGILNSTALRFPNEPARHKALDVIGDLALLGKRIQGKLVTIKSGHTSNVNFAKFLKKYQQEQAKKIPKYDPTKTPVYDVVQIAAMLPHRYPFLLVDKVIEITADKIVGVKNVTFNEPFFQGHFPNNPVMPGVLQVEAMAQVGGILALSTVPDPGNWDTYFLKIDETKFKQKVIPGDTLIFKLELLEPVRRGIVAMKGSAYVANKLVSEANLTAQIVRRTTNEATSV